MKKVLIGSFIFGFVVTVAEPDMHILARQVEAVSMGQIGKTLLLITVSVGVGLLVSLGILRMLKNMPLNRFFTIIYVAVLGMAFFVLVGFLSELPNIAWESLLVLLPVVILMDSYNTKSSASSGRPADRSSGSKICKQRDFGHL